MSLSANPIFRIFPPPRFLTIPSVGIDISDHSIRFAELKRKGKYFVLSRFGEEAIPENILISGEIKNVNALKEVLASFREKYKLHFVFPQQETQNQ